MVTRIGGRGGRDDGLPCTLAFPDALQCALPKRGLALTGNNRIIREVLGLMKTSQSSSTADMCAMIRGYHAHYAADPVFPDTFGAALTSNGWRRVIEDPILRRVVIEGAFRPMRRAAGTVLGRARYLEDRLEEAIAEGCTQYVIVGAGMDSFAARRGRTQPHVRVIELDHPATQEVKRARLSALPGNPATDVDYVPIDFNRDDIMNALRRSTFDANAATVFSWMGVSYYLPEQTVYAALGQMGACAAPGSQIIFDYSAPSDTHPSNGRLGTLLVNAITSRVGEPQISSFADEDVRGHARELGLEVIETVTGEMLRDAYFAHRDDRIQPPSHLRVARLRNT